MSDTKTNKSGVNIVVAYTDGNGSWGVKNR